MCESGNSLATGFGRSVDFAAIVSTTPSHGSFTPLPSQSCGLSVSSENTQRCDDPMKQIHLFPATSTNLGGVPIALMSYSMFFKSVDPVLSEATMPLSNIRSTTLGGKPRYQSSKPSIIDIRQALSLLASGVPRSGSGPPSVTRLSTLIARATVGMVASDMIVP